MKKKIKLNEELSLYYDCFLNENLLNENEIIFRGLLYNYKLEFKKIFNFISNIDIFSIKKQIIYRYYHSKYNY